MRGICLLSLSLALLKSLGVIKIYRILMLILLTLTLTSCSNIDRFEKTDAEIEINMREEIINGEYQFEKTDAEIEVSMLEELINGEYKFEAPIFVDAGKFKDMDYMLLVKEGKEYFTHTDVWYEYALIGNECDTYEKGKSYYNEINNLYKKKQIPTNFEALEREYSEGVIRQFYERHISAFSADGEKVLLKQYVAPFKAEEILYEVYQGKNILRPFLYREVLDRTQANYTTNLEYISLRWEKDSFYKTHTHGIEERDMVFSASTITDAKDTVYFKKDGRRIMLYSISDNKLVFESDTITLYPHTVTILEDKLIGGYYSKAKCEDDFHCLDYFEIDMNTNESKYLFTNREGVFSPDGKYLAYASGYTLDDGPVKVEKGYYIYCVDTAETAFFLTRIRDRENDRYIQSDKLNHIICWAKKDGLEGLLRLYPN